MLSLQCASSFPHTQMWEYHRLNQKKVTERQNVKIIDINFVKIKIHPVGNVYCVEIKYYYYYTIHCPVWALGEK